MASSQDSSAQSPKKARPQSLMALSFSAELDNLFHIDNSVEDLVLDVDRKHQSTTLLSLELSSLNGRLRETESRLKVARRASIRMGLAQVYQPSSSNSSNFEMGSLAYRSRRRESGGTDSNESSEGSASGSENLDQLKEEPEDEEDGGDGWQAPKEMGSQETLRAGDAHGLVRKRSYTTFG